MKRHLIAIGVVILLLAVGLSGCVDEIGLTNIGDIQANPEDYLGKEVKVKGSVVSHTIYDDNGHFLYIETDKTTLSGNYYLTGIMRYGITMMRLGEMYYLEVSTAKAV